MRRHHWPGNVRELKSRIRQAMLMSDDYLVHTEDLGLTPKPCPRPASRWTTQAAAR
jgi:DNA-binding NtrC family response regulator